jgi:UTP-glucose-1-phosphate uridylyltransferase
VLARKVRAFHPWPIAECELAGERLSRVTSIVEKPHPDVAPSNLAGIAIK